MRRLVPFAFVLALLPCLPAAAQSADAPRVDVVDVSGPLDAPAVRFVADSIQAAADVDSELVVIQLNSPGVVAAAEDWDRLVELVAAPPVPVLVWIGPAPAVAFGGAVGLAAAAQMAYAAPGVEVGHTSPVFVAGPDEVAAGLTELAATTVVVDGPIEGVVDGLAPAIQQLLAEVDGTEVVVDGAPRTLAAFGDDTEFVFHKPGYWTRFLRLAVTPEAAFLFLVAGLAVAAFEFYAIGPGVAAGVAALSLFLAAYGIHALPLRWWALALVLLGWWVMTDSYQRGSIAVLTGVGAAAMLGGGLFYVDGAPQLVMNPVVTVVIVGLVALFYVVAMPTVARSRFGTRTIGREHLIGRRGTALADFDPDGVVDIDGARWRASGHRESGIRRGDTVRVAEIDGLVLEVEPVNRQELPEDRENQP